MKSGSAAALTRREIAAGAGWRVSDVVYTSGPERKPLEDRHDFTAIAAIIAGTFRYRSAKEGVMLTPGAMLLGNAGATFECTFEDSPGDRCISFSYSPERFENIACGVPAARSSEFDVDRLPPLLSILPLIARAEVQSTVMDSMHWEELSLAVAGEALALAAGDVRPHRPPSSRDERRVSAVLHLIEERYAEPLSIDELAGAACMSPYHFMRTFRDVVGVTAYQYLLRTRLRQAAIALGTTSEPISAIAYGAGFGDLSTFAKAFRDAFKLSPGRYRSAMLARTLDVPSLGR